MIYSAIAHLFAHLCAIHYQATIKQTLPWLSKCTCLCLTWKFSKRRTVPSQSSSRVATWHHNHQQPNSTAPLTASPHGKEGQNGAHSTKSLCRSKYHKCRICSSRLFNSRHAGVEPFNFYFPKIGRPLLETNISFHRSSVRLKTMIFRTSRLGIPGLVAHTNSGMQQNCSLWNFGLWSHETLGGTKFLAAWKSRAVYASMYNYVWYVWYVWCILLFSALQVQIVYILSYPWSDYLVAALLAVLCLFAEVMHEMRSPGHHVLPNNPHRWHGLQHAPTPNLPNTKKSLSKLPMSACHLDPFRSTHQDACNLMHENNVCSHVQSGRGGSLTSFCFGFP